MNAIPSVRGTGSTGWSCPFKDRDVVVNAIPKVGRSTGDPRVWGFAPGLPRPTLGTRPVTTTGRGAFDARHAQGRAGCSDRLVEHPQQGHLPLLKRASAWSDPVRSRTQSSLEAKLDPSRPKLERRLARTTMEPMPRAHRDRRGRAPRVRWRSGSSCGKGVRAA